MILGFREGLNPLAVGRRGAVNVPANAGRADKGDALDNGVGEEDLRLMPAGGDNAQHARRQPGLGPQLGDAQRALRRETGRFQNHAVPRRHADGNHPAVRNHGREVPWGDAGEDAQRLVVTNRVVSGGDVHQRLPLHQVRRAAGELHHFDHLEDVAHGLVPLLSILASAQERQFLEVLFEQPLHIEEHLDALAHRGVAPRGEGFRRRPNALLDFRRGALGGQSDDRAG